MAAVKAKSVFLLFLFVSLQTTSSSFCQTSPFPISKWVNDLTGKKDSTIQELQDIGHQLNESDSVSAFRALAELEKSAPASNHYFNAGLFYLKAWVYRWYDLSTGQTYAKQFCTNALKEAYYTGDKAFISFISWSYGTIMVHYNEMELAAAYMVNAFELSKDFFVTVRDSSAITYLGEILFHAGVYDQSIYYTRMAIDSLKGWPGSSEWLLLKAWNTLGQGYQKTGNLDSALLCYQISTALSSKTKDTVWQGINAGFMGQVYFLRGQYDKAKPLFEYDYNINKNVDNNIAGYTLHWLGRLYLIEGQTDSALLTLKEALQFLHRPTVYLLQNRPYLEAAYYAMADAYRVTGNSDSFNHYFGLYARLHDSVQAVVVRSSLDVAQMRIDQEKNSHTVQLLQREKQSEELKRNFLIVAILLISVIIVLVLNRQRLQSKHRQQLALQQKAAAEAETVAAKEQLTLFTQNVIEKTALIEGLQHQLQQRKLSMEQQQLLEEVSHQTILTEEDWEKFKLLFERLYSGFFNRLKEKTPGITVAELRMAALTRLHLTTKEMASLLGISIDSVHKTRQRLRQRLQVRQKQTWKNLSQVFNLHYSGYKALKKKLFLFCQFFVR